MSNARSEPARWSLTREEIASGEVRRRVIESGYPFHVLTDEELAESRQCVLSEHRGGDVWVFGYGSLIWNPAFHFEERRTGIVHGFHRRFCLWTHAGRGTPEKPGLTLGLERGGSVTGCAFRLAPDAVESETDIVWRREMISGAYAPRWVSVRTDEGQVDAITFAINHDHERYTGLLPESRVAEVIADAAGPLGACVEYLANTVEHLAELDIHDHVLERLLDRVMAHREG